MTDGVDGKTKKNRPCMMPMTPSTWSLVWTRRASCSVAQRGGIWEEEGPQGTHYQWPYHFAMLGQAPTNQPVPNGKDSFRTFLARRESREEVSRMCQGQSRGRGERCTGQGGRERADRCAKMRQKKTDGLCTQFLRINMQKIQKNQIMMK